MIRRALDRGYLLAAAVLAVYAYLAPTTIVGGDNPELAALSVLGGRAHPSGYPLYVLYLRATSWLPGATAAHSAALATCVLGAAAVLALHAACRAWGARPAAASLACAIYAASPLVLELHTEAEVFALNALVVATIVWLAGEGGPVRGERRAIALALVAGLGLCDHLTCALVAPVGVYGAIRGVREATWRPGWTIAAALGALVVGLAPYVYVYTAPDTSVSWGHSESVRDVVRHFLRSDYGATSLSSHGGEAAPVAGIVALVGALGRGWWWLPLGIGIGALVVRSVRGTSRAAWGALAASWVLAGPVFAALLNIDPARYLFIVQRMYLLPLVLLGVPVAVGLDALAGARVRLASTPAGSWLALLVFALLAVPSLGAVAAAHSPAVEDGLVNTLRALPENSAMIVDGDDYMFGVPYVQDVLGVRRDVIAVPWPTIGFRWGLARLAARGVPFDPAAVGPDPASVRLADQLLASGHAVFVDDFQGNILAARPSYPYAGMMRVLPRGAAVPPVATIFADNARAFAEFELDYPLPGPDDGFMTMAHARYATTWLRIADLCQRAGFAEPARDAAARAAAISPR